MGKPLTNDILSQNRNCELLPPVRYFNLKDLDYEIIVSDNVSTDGSIEMIKTTYPEVVLLQNNSNLGFGKGNNRGGEKAKGKYIFYLNSDTILLNNAIKYFFDYFEANENNLGALGCNLLKPDMTQNFSFAEFGNTFGLFKELVKLFLSNTKKTLIHLITKKPFKEYNNSSENFKKTLGKVDYISGASLFLKNNSFSKFDEHYFMYFEEADLQYQLYRNNLDRIIIDGPQIIHFANCSSKKISKEFSEIHKVLSKFYYYKKNLSNPFELFFLKRIQKLIWLNPYIYDETKKYIKELMKI